MKYFFCKLTPPRPTFMIDMTDVERQLMRQHVAYWSDLAAKGSAIIFGPVADPQGGYGVAVVEAPDEATVREWSTHDPVMKAGAGFSYAISAIAAGRSGGTGAVALSKIPMTALRSRARATEEQHVLLLRHHASCVG